FRESRCDGHWSCAALPMGAAAQLDTSTSHTVLEVACGERAGVRGPASGGVDQDELGVFESTHLYHWLIADRGTVTGIECHTIDLDRAFGRDEIAVPFFPERVFGGLARLQCRAENPRVGADRQGIIVARIAAR